MDKLKKYEVETLVDYFTAYVHMMILSNDDESAESAVAMHKLRDNLINHLMEKFGEEEQDETPKPVYEGVRCPDCDGEMVSRKSQYGTFWGCKKYPRCRGTRDSEGRTKEEARLAKEKDRESPQPIDELYKFSRKQQ